MATPLYTAQATILIKNKAPQVFDYLTLDSSSGGPAESTSAWDINSKTEYQLLNARSLAAKVIVTEALGAWPSLVFAAKANCRRLRISTIPDSQAIVRNSWFRTG
jgi:hypothetical protein